MIRISLKDKKLETDPEVRKWLAACEKLINERLPEEKLKKIAKEIHRYILTGEPYFIDAEGNITGLYKEIK